MSKTSGITAAYGLFGTGIHEKRFIAETGLTLGIPSVTKLLELGASRIVGINVKLGVSPQYIIYNFSDFSYSVSATPTAQVETVTFVGTSLTEGTIIVTLTTGRVDAGSVQMTIIIPAGTDIQWGQAVYDALITSEEITDIFDLSYASAVMTITERFPAYTNDTTLSLSMTMGTATGSLSVNSVNTTAAVSGVALAHYTDSKDMDGLVQPAPSGGITGICIQVNRGTISYKKNDDSRIFPNLPTGGIMLSAATGDSKLPHWIGDYKFQNASPGGTDVDIVWSY